MSKIVSPKAAARGVLEEVRAHLLAGKVVMRIKGRAYQKAVLGKDGEITWKAAPPLPRAAVTFMSATSKPRRPSAQRVTFHWEGFDQ